MSVLVVVSPGLLYNIGRIAYSPNRPFPMVTTELSTYIDEQTAAGHTPEDITAALKSAGWTEEVITQAFSGAHTGKTAGMPAASTSPTPSSNPINPDPVHVKPEGGPPDIPSALSADHAEKPPEKAKGASPAALPHGLAIGLIVAVIILILALGGLYYVLSMGSQV
jgi:hypothetical protein